MSLFAVLSLVLALAALFSYVNHRFIGLPTTIGVTLIALLMSLALIGADAAGLPARAAAISVVGRLDFRAIVLDWMLPLLLFAGALSVDLEQIIGQKRSIALLATAGVVVSTALVGAMTWALGRSLGLGIDPVESLLFGALISPTDPIAVLGILRGARAPKALEAQIAGESLFNDGVAVALFALLLEVAVSEHGPAGVRLGEVALVFAREVGGSVALGWGVGWLAFALLRSVDDYHVEVLLTLALALGLYGLASGLHTSGPLAVVVAGLLIGGRGRAQAMSPRTIQHLDTFWELVDEILNVLLFVLIGFQVLVVHLSRGLLLVGLAAVVVVLAARALSVGAAVLALRRFQTFAPHTVKILTWGGLRGGLSIALALSLGPEIAGVHTIQAATYVVAVFSIAVQGLTFGRLVRATTRAP
ncbi:MAG TPA: sodium:proton antiporter [Polyangia bacterium]|nr:sodium:proton antiporter [Polyangia bacterium]